MSEEAAPEQAREPSVPEQQGPPKGLLQQMEELMAALTADLTQLDADLQQSASVGGTASTDAKASADAPPHGSGPRLGPGPEARIRF
jgi:hypothetical protein